MLKWRLLGCFLSTHTRSSNFPLPKGSGKKNAQNVLNVPGPDGEFFCGILIFYQTPFFCTVLVQSCCGSLSICLFPNTLPVNEKKGSGRCNWVHAICAHVPMSLCKAKLTSSLLCPVSNSFQTEENGQQRYRASKLFKVTLPSSTLYLHPHGPLACCTDLCNPLLLAHPHCCKRSQLKTFMC